jgi:hypothetical protein
MTPQVKAFRFETREAALAAKDAIPIMARLSKSLLALSEKIESVINQK